jgi:hypothetical protein
VALVAACCNCLSCRSLLSHSSTTCSIFLLRASSGRVERGPPAPQAAHGQLHVTAWPTDPPCAILTFITKLQPSNDVSSRLACLQGTTSDGLARAC